jgi:hypothetical protein
MPHHDEIEPATAPTPTCRSAIFTPDLLEVNSRLLWLEISTRYSLMRVTHIELLSWERPASDTGGVSLDNPDDLSNPTRRDTEAGTYSAYGCGATRHVRICAVVDVEHQRVCTFDEDVFVAGCERLMYVHDAVDDERA